MNFDPAQPVVSQQQQNPQDPLVLSSQRVDDIQHLGPVGVVGEGVGQPNSLATRLPDGVLPADNPSVLSERSVQCYDNRDRLYVDPNAVEPLPVLSPAEVIVPMSVGVAQGVKQERVVDEEGVTTYFEESGPKQKRARAEGTGIDSSALEDCGQAISVFSGVPPVLNQDILPPLPQKRRAGLRKSTDTRKNNNRVALRDFTCGRRCVTDVVPINPPMVAHLKVVSGVSSEKVLRKNKKSMFLDVGQHFGVLQLFVEGHPKPDEKVWITTQRGVFPVLSTAVQSAMSQLTISMRDYPVIARGRVRRDPQKQGTRPKAGEPIVDCYGIYVGDERRPLWVETSLISVGPSSNILPPPPPPPQPLDDQSQLQAQSMPPPLPPVEPSSVGLPVSMAIPVPRPEDSLQPSQQSS